VLWVCWCLLLDVAVFLFSFRAADRLSQACAVHWSHFRRWGDDCSDLLKTHFAKFDQAGREMVRPSVITPKLSAR
jgi:hypothetical protein